MLRDLSNLQKIYIACGRTDLRKGIDGLATLVEYSGLRVPIFRTMIPHVRNSVPSDFSS